MNISFGGKLWNRTFVQIERFLKSDIHSLFLVYKLEYQPVSMESLWLRNRSFVNVIL